MDLVILQRAEGDSQSIYNRLEDFRDGRGETFLRRLDSALSQISQFPESAPFAYKGYRRMLIRGFPHAIFYAIEGNRIIVVTVATLRQDPKNIRMILDFPHW